MKKATLVICMALVLGLTVVASAADFVTTDNIPQPLVEYWTKERLMNAKPYPLPALSGVSAPKDSLPAEMLENTPRINKGELRGTSALLSQDESVALAFSGAIEPMANGYDYPPPHTTFNVLRSLYGSLYSKYPYRTIGKVYFTSGGVNYVCSGSSIGGRAVLTAGHCVSDGYGQWHTNWKFAPAYKNYVTPYGLWSAFWLTTFNVWHYNQNFCRDVGFAAVSDIGGYKLSQKVGYLSFAWNWSRIQHWNMFGYPAASPYNGQYMVETQASYARQDSPAGCTPYTTGIGSDQTGGTSGGPWILRFVPGSAGARNYANGVNSYIWSNEPYQLYSPYFDSSVKSLKDTAVSK